MMDLKVVDIAVLLNVTEKEVEQHVLELGLPAYQIDQEYRFNREEVEEWIVRRQSQLEEDTTFSCGSDKAALKYSLYKALFRGDVLIDVPGNDKETIIRSTMKIMANKFNLDPVVMTELLLSRERLMSTGIGDGWAIPHTRDFLLKTYYDVVIVVYPEHPIPYASLDGKDVDLMIFLFASEDKNHLNLINKIVHLRTTKTARTFLSSKPNKEELLIFLKSWESALFS
ncbi:Uncharacterized protein CLAVI_000543 [Candidatus Clavichlamydia salmonicola]|uniref:PTS sugar transporter subunit IIA n=1 Tax=Candidatus Clavichlamydia salmonicola TaxID=469812 RepID=UPI001E59A256|nr:PTS sugar transporter subunit IIA [Candidatus Clavichlamydia salmonicola]MBF5050921.1 Uncharacterized protein [Candidatus Clavichlamydia salmonicola]